MSNFSSKEYQPTAGVFVSIVDQGELVTLDYQGSMTNHSSSLWWGTAVGYRAMQMAAKALSGDSLWSRDNLVVVSGHPGPGVLDSLNFVTKCVDNDNCTVMQNPNCVSRCNSEMKFEWWVSDGERTAHISLREDFVSEDFYQLIDRRVYHENSAEDDRIFELYKVNMSARIWVAPLEESFSVEYLPPLEKGEIPSGHDWSLVPEAKASVVA